MYETYFGLTERPFSIAPDPHYLYMSTRHKEAMAHLTYGLSQGGCFIVLTGEVGTGKTTLCRNLLSDIPDNVDVALILNANINEDELLQTLCDELKIKYPKSSSQKILLDKLNEHLLDTFANNRHTVLIIDEAQLLSRDVLEKIRLLTNLETTKTKLLQIILIGQPELNQALARNDLRQLAQRVTARYHLGALKRNEIEEYVNYRLSVAACKQPLFSRQALNSLHSATAGIPRKINVLADHALLAAYAKNQLLVDAKTIKQAAKEVFIQPQSATPKLAKISRGWWFAALLILLNLSLWWWFVSADETAVVTSQHNQTAPSTPASTTADNTASLDSANPPSSEHTPIENNQQSDSIAPITESITETITASANDNALAPNQPINSDADFDKVLETAADLTGRIAGLKTLATLWQIDLSAPLIDDACDTLAENAMTCLNVTSWQQLMRLNRPAVLALQYQNKAHHVVLQSITGDTAQLLIGEATHRLSIEQLRAKWSNQAVILWRKKPFMVAILQSGDESAQLPKIRQYLNQALRKTALPTLNDLQSSFYDVELSQKIFALQNRFGIRADGRIGNETYALLNEILDPENTLSLTNRQPQ